MKSHKGTETQRKGMASPTYYCSRNTQVPKERFRNENKVLQHRNTGEKICVLVSWWLKREK
jgi:hypothetical protein